LKGAPTSSSKVGHNGHETQQLRTRLVSYSILGIFGISVSIATACFTPLYQHLRQQQEDWLADTALYRAAAVDRHLKHQENITAQITSRTHIREALEAYNRREISLAQLQQLSESKLLEALRIDDAMFSINRYDAEQQLVIQVSDTQRTEAMAPDLRTLVPVTVDAAEARVEVQTSSAFQDDLVVKATVPILNPLNQEQVGTDIALFSAEPLRAILQDRTGLGKTGQVVLVRPAAAGKSGQIWGQGLSFNDLSPETLAVLMKTEVNQLIELGNSSQLGITVPLQNSDWRLAFWMDQQEVYAPIRQQLIPVAFLVVGLSILQTLGIILILKPLAGRVLVHTEELQAINHQLQAACEQSPVAIVITDTRGRIEYVNPTFEIISGYSAAEVIGQNPRLLKSGHTSAEQYRNLWQTILSGNIWKGELRNRRKSGELLWESVSIAPVKNNQGVITHFVAVEEDITVKKRAQDALEYEARHDPLTGLLNRTQAIVHLEQAIDRARHHGTQGYLFFIDLDGFKAINDTYGHEVGDQLLVTIAKRLQHSLRQSDITVRLGGDEFLVILPTLDRQHQAEKIADKILNTLTDPVVLDDVILKLTGSLGMVSFPADDLPPLELINRADIAMYQAKHKGQGQWCLFQDDMLEPGSVPMQR
jgi:diguanylate cyclase (GGDEF)-like protein/PAS domain S-box-containing protein